MQKLQCELCGSIDFMRTDDGFFQCQHCSCKYTLEQAKTLISGTVEITRGDLEVLRRLENLRILFEMKDYWNGNKELRDLEKTFAGDYRIWEFHLKHLINLYYEISSQNPLKNLMDAKQIYDKINVTCQEEKIRKQIEKEFKSFVHRALEDARNVYKEIRFTDYKFAIDISEQYYTEMAHKWKREYDIVKMLRDRWLYFDGKAWRKSSNRSHNTECIVESGYVYVDYRINGSDEWYRFESCKLPVMKLEPTKECMDQLEQEACNGNVVYCAQCGNKMKAGFFRIKCPVCNYIYNGKDYK